MTITKEFFLLRGVTVQLLCFADNSIGRSTSKFFVKGGMYFRLNSEIYEMTVFGPLFTIFFLDMELICGEANRSRDGIANFRPNMVLGGSNVCVCVGGGADKE